ncbi:leucine--tRNA ligase [Candidatus Pacearchaeota archaeon CG10_big_fil_rev_8_21_14_0_10_34_76]|nr:MAG: leucine--tRNA ligase [Candidatus Pacearchaeota archaeon CG10_big_fil_rev_8_21_14_0_10_34_76]
MADKIINFSAIEKKWQKKWESEKAFLAKDNVKGKKKYYILEMYPYPSGSGLHMGHAFNYTIGDVQARLKRMQGYNVLYPMGYDSFGLPAENAAIKAKSHPKKFTEEAIKNYIRQQKELGLSYDWSRMIQSHKPEYYQWDQWIFLKMFERGLAYKKKAPVNWCGKCNTVLANEQVVNGKCWRHEDTEVEIKHLEQWFLKITDYADELYEGLNKLDGWPDFIKTLQRNWIGKSEGTEVDFLVDGNPWRVFTTRVDTLFGVTFLVVSAQHPELMSLVTNDKKKEVENFLKKIRSTKEEDMDKLSKEGVFTGSYAIHPLTGKKIPVWTGNFVVADYGSGMVMGVPAHDERDFEFAKKYGLEIKQVIRQSFGEAKEDEEKRFTISAVVQRKSDKKFLYLKWKEFGWVAPVIGGIDGNETPESAAEREVFEETGYKAKAVGKLGLPFEAHFYADNKKVWRHRIDQPILLELISDNPEKLNKEESSMHEVSWLSREEVAKLTTHSYNLIGIERFFEGEKAFTGFGTLVNSEGFDGLKSSEAKEHIINALEMKKLGRKKTAFRIRDWLVSRQRFWGCPIPIIYCDECGTVPVPEKDLPVKLPDNVKFEGVESPLKKDEKFLKVKCPKCGKNGKRETNTLDGFMDSSWYFLRYCDPKNDKKIFNSKKVKYWAPVDQYIGGKEHATGHLIYFRFFTKFLRDMGLLEFDEPVLNLFNQGMLHAYDGQKMSKSKGNVVLPESVSKKFGIDAARMFLVSDGSPDKDFNWSDKGTEGSLRFILKVINFVSTFKSGKMDKLKESKLHKIIKEYTSNLDDFNYNIAVIKIRELFDVLEEGCDRKSLEIFLKMLSPICPHVAEELWSKIGKKEFVSLEKWPEYDGKKIDIELEKKADAVDKTIEDVKNILKIMRERNGGEGKRIYIYVLPNEKAFYDEKKLGERLGRGVWVYAVNDPKKHDPEGKSKKVKPGRPGIYIE